MKQLATHSIFVSLMFTLIPLVSSATDWRLVDDFESYSSGEEISEQSRWQGAPGFESAQVIALEDGNLVAQIGPGQAIVTAGGIDSVAIPEGGTGMLYFKFRMLRDSKFWGGVFGMARAPAGTDELVDACWLTGRAGEGPRPFGKVVVPGRAGDSILVNNRGSLNRAYEGRPQIEAETWYCLWVTVDNSRDELRFFIEGGDFETRTELTHFRQADETFFPFKVRGALDLRHFVIASPISDEGQRARTIQVDDVNFVLRTPARAIAGAQ